MNFKTNFYTPILFGAILILTGLSSLLTDLLKGISENLFLAATIVPLVVFFLPLAFYCRVRGVNLVSAVKLNYVAPKKISFLVIVTLILISGIAVLRYFGLFFFSSAFVDTPGAIFIPIASDNSFLVFFCNVLLPALFEESLFRGLILEEYRSYGPLWAVMASSVMYGMIHASFENLLFYVFIGMMLGIITVASDSLVPAILIHIGLNYSYLNIRPAVVEYLRQAGKSPLLPYLLVAVLLILFVLLFSRLENIYRDKVYDELLQSRREMIRRELEKSRETQEEKTTENPHLTAAKSIFLSPTFLATLAVYAILVWGFQN